MKKLISENDFAMLEKAAASDPVAGSALNEILQAAHKVPEDKLPSTTVKLNSIVYIWHALLKKVVKLRIVLPDLADLKTRNISVFAPISLALFGRKENDNVTMPLGPLTKRLKIIHVTNR